MTWMTERASLLPLPFRILQPLSHLLVLHGVQRPASCSTIPTVVPDGHVDAVVDDESHRVVVLFSQEDQMVQDARRLMRVPVGVDVCAVLEEEIRHVVVTVDDGEGERGV